MLGGFSHSIVDRVREALGLDCDAGVIEAEMAGILFIISAPSGSGKSTLVTQLRSLVEGLEFSVSYTTRAPRGSEEDGREYHFVTPAQFRSMVAAGEFLEWAEVFGNFYGTAVSALKHAHDTGKDLLLDVDVQGAKQVMQRRPEAVSIFVLPPSPEVLEKRLRARSKAEHVEDERVIERRLSQARLEVKQLWDYRYALVNDALDKAVEEFRAIVLDERGEQEAGVRDMAEICRTDRNPESLRSILQRFWPE